MNDNSSRIIIEELESISHLLNATVYPEWSAILLGMIGACYCLDKAEKISDTGRSEQLQHREGLSLLKKMKRGQAISEHELKSWFAGYYLNSAELRIQSCLHRLLQVFCDEDKQIRVLLHLLKKKCAHCGRNYVECSRETEQLLTELERLFPRKHIQQSIKSPAACLVRVWKRVNEIKHGRHPKVDITDPLDRCEDSNSALLSLIHIFKDFSRAKGVLNEN